MRAYAVALLALLAVSQLSHPAWAQEDDVEDMEGEDGDYGDDGYGGEGYDEDNEGYGDDEGGGPPPPAEITELKSVEDFDKFLDDEDASVVGYFSEAGQALDDFKETAQGMQFDYRFAFTTSEELLSQHKYKSAVVVYKPPRFVSDKVEKAKARYSGADFKNAEALRIFLREKSLPLVGQLTYKTRERYTARAVPLVRVFFDVDYKLNAKGSNYYVNRVRKVAQEYVGKLSFAIASIKDFGYESADYGLKLEEGKRQVGVGLDNGDKRYGMGETEFSADNLKAFVESFLAGSLTPTKVVEPYTPPPAGGEDPDEEGGDIDESGVTVLTPDNFDAVVDPGKNVMLEFYAPWCGHCKMLKPEYAKLGKEFAADDDVVIAKMDADAHKAPKGWEVQGFPTLFFQPKGGKAEPYEGARNAREMAEFIRAHKA